MGPMTIGSELPSTLGGPGWLARERTHSEEMRDGLYWSRCGYRSETGRLRQVMLTQPSAAAVAAVTDARAHLMTEPIDFSTLAAQAAAVHDAFHDVGVDIVTLAADNAPPNVLFARDLFFVTPEGAILARMASRQRAGEERYAAAALAAAGIPILATPTAGATFEGADALWLDTRTVMVGVGRRTNAAGAALVTRVLADQGVRVVRVRLPLVFQHLLGAVTFVDSEVAALHGAAPAELRELLVRFGIHAIELAPTADIVACRGMNLVALGPRRVLMPARCPTVKHALERFGVEAREVEVGEYIKAAGGVGCLTGILRRDE
jgi:N-dimethylarginine dimethylaminohydrolase